MTSKEGCINGGGDDYKEEITDNTVDDHTVDVNIKMDMYGDFISGYRCDNHKPYNEGLILSPDNGWGFAQYAGWYVFDCKTLKEAISALNDLYDPLDDINDMYNELSIMKSDWIKLSLNEQKQLYSMWNIIYVLSYESS